jgi:hypothetical protein
MLKKKEDSAFMLRRKLAYNITLINTIMLNEEAFYFYAHQRKKTEMFQVKRRVYYYVHNANTHTDSI